MRIKNKHESNVSKKRRYFNLSIARATLIVAAGLGLSSGLNPGLCTAS